MFYRNERFHKKEYDRYLQSELNDDVLSPLSDEIWTKDFTQKIQNYQPKATQMTSKTKTYIPRFNLRFPHPKFATKHLVEVWQNLPIGLGETILTFFPLHTLLLMIKTCKYFYEQYKEVIWRISIERKLKVNLSKEKVFSSQDYLGNFCKSLHYSLQASIVLSTKAMFDSKNQPLLALHLVDFVNTSSQLFESFGQKDLIPTLMLSHQPKRHKITLWANRKPLWQFNDWSPRTLSTYVFREYEFSNVRELVSIKFHTERFLVIQMRERLEETEELIFKVGIIDLMQEFSFPSYFLEGDLRFQHCLSITTSENALQIEANKAQRAHCEGSFAISEFLIKGDYKDELLLFYTKDRESISFLYNIKSRKIEGTRELQLKTAILEAFIPKKNPTENESTIVLLDENMELEIVSMSQYGHTFPSQKIFGISDDNRNFEDKEESFGLHKYQYGAFDGTEYLVLRKKNEFYFLNLQTRSIQKILTVLPSSKGGSWFESDGKGGGRIHGKTVRSWSVFEDLLAMILSDGILCILKINKNGGIIRLTRDDQSVLSYSMWNNFEDEPLVQTTLKQNFDLTEQKFAPLIFMTHSNLIIVSFSETKQKFKIFFSSLPEIIMSKDPELWISSRDSHLNINLNIWEVSSEDIYDSDPRAFFKNLSLNGDYLNIAKFEGNLLLLRLGSLNVFFHFESFWNFRSSYQHTNQPFHSFKPQVLEIKVPLELKTNHEKISEEPKSARPISKPASKPKPFQSKKPKKGIEVEETIPVFEKPKKKSKRKDLHAEEEEKIDPTEDETEEKKSKKQQRKEFIESLLDRSYFDDHQVPVFLKGVKNSKDWLMKKVDKLKEIQKEKGRSGFLLKSSSHKEL